MNEIRELILGIDLGRDCAQLSYFDRRQVEARSVPVRAGSAQFEVPMLLCRRTDREEYCIGQEAEYFSAEKGGKLLRGLYDRLGENQSFSLGDAVLSPDEALSHYLRGLLAFLGVVEVEKNTAWVCLTSPSLCPERVLNYRRALMRLGFPAEKILLMDYAESFYYYVMRQKMETWNRSVGWFAFLGDAVSFSRLVIGTGTRPALVRIERGPSVTLPPEGTARDEAFGDYVADCLGTELYSSVQITGTGFDTTWADKSVGRLCQQKRKVFYGNNLFARGACEGAKEKMEDKKLAAVYRFQSDSLVHTEVGMLMTVMGSSGYVPFLESGKNWYDLECSRELILDGTDELVFLSTKEGREDKKQYAMKLPGLPKRPNRTTRLKVSLSYLSQKDCLVRVEDLGFGEMFPSSRQVWTETVQW